jgi:hypothetical protein
MMLSLKLSRQANWAKAIGRGWSWLLKLLTARSPSKRATVRWNVCIGE